MPLWRSLEREYPPTTGNHWLRAVERRVTAWGVEQVYHACSSSPRFSGLGLDQC